MYRLVGTTGDGHCGFRAVSYNLLGSPTRWRLVRQALLDELALYKSTYESMGINPDRLRYRIDYFGNTWAPSDYWYTSSNVLC